MKLTIFCAAVSIAGRSSATTAAAAAARPTARTTQLTRLSPRSSRRTRSAHSRSRNQSASSIVTLLSLLALHGLGEEAEKAVGDEQHEHRQQGRERRVHRQVGTVGGALEVAVLLGARFTRLLTQELEVGALLRRQQLGEASEGRLARIARDPYERLPLAEPALPARQRERPLQLRAERTGGVARGQLERLAQRLARAQRQREHGDRLRQVEEDRLAPALHLRAQDQIGHEKAGDREQQRDTRGGQASDRGRVGEQRHQRRRDREQRLLRKEAWQRLATACAAKVAPIRLDYARERGRRLDPERPAVRPAGDVGSLRPRQPDRKRGPAAAEVEVREQQPASEQAEGRQREQRVHR